MAKRVPLPTGVSCPADNSIILTNNYALPDDVAEGKQALDLDGITYPGWQGEIPKIEQYTQQVGFDASNPPWLCDHAYEHCKGADPKPSCDTCQPWLNMWKERDFPNGYLRPDSGRGAARGIYGHDSFTNLCGMWTTPDFFEECDFFDKNGDQIPKKVVEYSIAYASEILYKLSGRQFQGMCERVVYPGCETGTQITPAYRDTFYQRDADYNYLGYGYGEYGGAINPLQSQNLMAGGFGCCDNACNNNGCAPDTLRLPGPINEVIEVVIDGEVLPRSRYGIRANKELVRLDGRNWPRFNDMNKSPWEGRKAIQATSTATCNGLRTGKEWVEPWIKELNLPCRDELKVKLSAPDWVNEFLRNHPECIQNLPCCEPWVQKWLAGNGLKSMKVPAECAKTMTIMEEREVVTMGGFPANQCCANGDGPVPTARCCSGNIIETTIVLVPVEIDLCPDDETNEDACNWLAPEPPKCTLHPTAKDCRYEALVTELQQTKGGCSSWAIRYYQGKCPPISGQLAAAALAAHVARWICVEGCFPDNTARVVSEGIDIRLQTRFQSIFKFHPTQIPAVDFFLASVNPAGLQRRGYAKRASTSKNPRIQSIR